MEINKTAVQYQEAIEAVGEALSELASAIFEALVPIIRALNIFYRRYGFYNWMEHRFGNHHLYNRRTKALWWIAWHLPSFLILRLPPDWVKWPE